jgi:hypothetical protein
MLGVCRDNRANRPGRACVQNPAGAQRRRGIVALARKLDIKQFRQACAEAGLTASERYEASDALHAEKESGLIDDMTYGELVDRLREWKASRPL